MKNKNVIVRTQAAGVFAGELKSLSENGVADLANARRLWQWSGAASLSELSVFGVAKPKECKFPIAVSKVKLFGVIEVLPLKAKAKASIDAVPIWSAR
jgi:hypothetical protein